MPNEQWLFVSDVHLAPDDRERQEELATFLLGFPGLTHLCIVGDLFDFWMGLRDRQFAGYDTILSAVRRLADRGVAIHYVEGNHDFCLGTYFAARYGVRIYPEGTTLTLGGWRVWIEHGDLANPEEVFHRTWRRFARSGAAAWLAERLGPRRLQTFGRWLDRVTTPADYSRRTKAHPCFHAHARRCIARGYDVVVMGHAHVPGDEAIEVDGRHGRYLNAGDWIFHKSYVTFNPHHGFCLHNPRPVTSPQDRSR
jgi:UDP-2,3-diacylglucosamine hydrolase